MRMPFLKDTLLPLVEPLHLISSHRLSEQKKKTRLRTHNIDPKIKNSLSLNITLWWCSKQWCNAMVRWCNVDNTLCRDGTTVAPP